MVAQLGISGVGRFLILCCSLMTMGLMDNSNGRIGLHWLLKDSVKSEQELDRNSLNCVYHKVDDDNGTETPEVFR